MIVDHIFETIPWISMSYSQVCWDFDQLYLVVSLTEGLMGLKIMYLLWAADPTDHCWHHLGAISFKMFCLELKLDGKCIFYFSSWPSNHFIFCTWHNSSATFCCEYFIRSRIRTKWICHWFSFQMEKSLVKWSLDVVSVWNTSACLWGFRCDAATSIQNIFHIVMLNFAQHISAD